MRGSISSGSSSRDVNLPFNRPCVSTAALPLWPQSAVATECAAVAIECMAVAIECAAVVIVFSVIMDHMWHASLHLQSFCWANARQLQHGSVAHRSGPERMRVCRAGTR